MVSISMPEIWLCCAVVKEYINQFNLEGMYATAA
jgi:hypothetical protein